MTAATGAYGPLTKTGKTEAYGRIAVSVDKVCRDDLVLYEGRHPCQKPGYDLIAKIIVTKYDALKPK